MEFMMFYFGPAMRVDNFYVLFANLTGVGESAFGLFA